MLDDATLATQESAWSDVYTAVAAADKLDETARRLQIKIKQMANQKLAVEQQTRLATQKMQIQRQDVLFTALRQLQAASAAELYSEAARLRDESLAWLDGWWKPMSTGQRLTSLLHVSNKSHGRWTARLFSAVDFIHYDMNSQQQQACAQIDMQQMIRDPRYGTVLFEVFVLPAAAAGSWTGQPRSQPEGSSSSVDNSSSPCDSMSEEAITSSSYTTLVVALQSANRALNELLQVLPTAGPATPTPTSSGVSNTSCQPELKPINQRILLLLWRHTAAAVAVQAGNDQTLWVWNVQLPSQLSCNTTEGKVQTSDATATTANSSGVDKTDSSRSSSDYQQSMDIDGPSPPQQHQTSTSETTAAASAVSLPTRPAECCTGALVPTFSVDWREIDLLRGPGSIKRTDQNRFKFVRNVLPVDVPISIATDGSSGIDGQKEAQLFRVDLQYMTAASSHLAGGLDAAATGAVAAAAPIPQLGRQQPDWAVRAAQQVQQLIQQQNINSAADQYSGSNNSSNGEDSSDSASAVADLLAAAAEGSAPAGGWVSEVQRPVTVTTVAPLRTSSDSAATTMEFERIIDDLVVLNFGAWELAGRQGRTFLDRTIQQQHHQQQYQRLRQESCELLAA